MERGGVDIPAIKSRRYGQVKILASIPVSQPYRKRGGLACVRSMHLVFWWQNGTLFLDESLYQTEVIPNYCRNDSAHHLLYLPLVPLRSHSDLFFVSIFLVMQIMSSGVSPRRDILTCPATSPLLTNAPTLDALPRICTHYRSPR